jgi:hypothetical protein
MISVHERLSFGSSAGRYFKVSSNANITESEYHRLSKGKDLVDTVEALECLTQNEQRAARYKDLENQLDDLAPKCDKCGSGMKRKYGKHGKARRSSGQCGASVITHWFWSELHSAGGPRRAPAARRQSRRAARGSCLSPFLNSYALGISIFISDRLVADYA